MDTLSQKIRKCNSTPEEERIADAAPDLLAACKFALSVLREQGLIEMSEQVAADELVSAISKAKGGAA